MKSGKRNKTENDSLMTCWTILSSLIYVSWIQELEKNTYKGEKKIEEIMADNFTEPYV